MTDGQIDLERYRLGKTVVIDDLDSESHDRNICGVDVHVSHDGTAVLIVQMHGGGPLFFWPSVTFSTGWFGSAMTSGEWVLAKPGAFLSRDREVAEGYTATVTRQGVWVRGSGNAVLEFR